MLKLCHRLDEAVCQWPRLGYLTKDEVVKTIAYRGDILPIIPLINKVFPSIKTLHFLKSSSKSKRDLSTGWYAQIHTVFLMAHDIALCRISSDWS